MDIDNFLPELQNLQQQIADKLQGQTKDSENYNELPKCNILLIGKTGVGKSTLINSIFRVKLAPEGAGKPVTDKLTRYSEQGCPIIAFDTKGLELTDEDILRTQQDVQQLIERNYSEFPNVRIDVIYYCINSSSERFEDIEEDWINSLNQYNIPIIIVLTKTYEKPEYSKLFQFFKKLQNNEAITNSTNLRTLIHCITQEQEITIDRNKVPVIPILAEPYLSWNDQLIPQHNLDLLVRQTASLLEEQPKQAFISQQTASIDLKVKEAQKLAVISASMTSLLALIPVIPVSGTILPPTQMFVLKQISSIFGLKQEEQDSLFLSSEFQELVAVIVTTSASTILTNLLPVVGSISDAVVAGTSTSLLCLAWIDTLKRRHSKLVEETTLTEEEIRQFIEIFEEEYQKYCDNIKYP